MNEFTNTPPKVKELVDFMCNIRPFDCLSPNELIKAASQCTTTYHRANSTQAILDYDNPSLFLVRSGVFDVRDAQGDLIDRVVEGGFFGFISLLTGSSKGHTLHVVEDGLLHRFDQTAFKDLRHISNEFDHFFSQAFEQRLRVGLRKRSENSALATRLSDIMSEHLYSVHKDASIINAAQLMTDKNIASIAVVDHDNALVGIFTDKDCRTRVIANGVSSQKPIHTVMTPNPITIDHHAMVHEATILMIRHQIKHIPVVKDGKAVAMVTLSDLIRLQRSDPVLIINEIYRAKTTDDVAEISKQIPELLLHLIKLDVRADDLGRILTSVTGALTRRLIQLAQEKLGPEPVPFVWLAFGSQGRQDQSAKSDQDNALLISNLATPGDDAYFESLAKFVCHGLDACGYVYCPGDIMAQNKQWRLNVSQWQAVFAKWINQPSRNGLMNASIFFDIRPIYRSNGASGLFKTLHESVVEKAQNNSIFLSLLTQNALELTPPIGMFKRLVVDKNSEQKNTLDLKLRGVVPITDIARIHALCHGVSSVNTRDRLIELAKINAINEHDAQNLLDAHEFIAHQRLLHQGQQLQHSQMVDNHLKINALSSLTVRHLKDAFQVVRNAQSGLRQRYSP